MKRQLLLCVLPVILLLPFNLFGKCPISSNGTLELLAPAGNLIVDTTGIDSVEVEVSNRQVVLKETCGRDVVMVTASMSGRSSRKRRSDSSFTARQSPLRRCSAAVPVSSVKASTEPAE